ncbi:MAG: ABC transporter permease subunit, partial [Phycisphaerales bacterium]|nr:ABC transporter permease subunit [Phycisphaerales bacterium]
GDATIKGRVQMFMAYSLGFSSFVLALLTILFSCRSLSREIESRQIFGLVTKPVPRWQILAGKWCGIMALNVLLMA